MVRDFIPLMIALLWPVTILILVCWFRKGIKNLIASVTEAKIGNSMFIKFGQSPSDVKFGRATGETLSSPVVAKEISAPSAVKWENVANLFWLGDDLEWTAQTVLRGAPKERILHGLIQCELHGSELGLADSAPGKRLSSLKSEVEILPESALDRVWRNDFAEKIALVIGGFGILVEQRQPNFRSSPQSSQ